MSKTQATPFVPFAGHRQMQMEDADIFLTAAEMLVEQEVTKAIRGAGGDQAHINHFGRKVCGHIPPAAWAEREDRDVIVAKLREVGEELK